MQTYSDSPSEPQDLVSWLLDDDSRALRARRILWPVIIGYVGIVWGLIAWAMVRPDHTTQIMVMLMADVIVTPFLALVTLLRRARVSTVARRSLAFWVLDRDARTSGARSILWPVIIGYVAIALGLIAWAMVRPDHTVQILAVMGVVIVAPFATLLRR